MSRHTSLLVLESEAMFRAFGIDRAEAASRSGPATRSSTRRASSARSQSRARAMGSKRSEAWAGWATPPGWTTCSRARRPEARRQWLPQGGARGRSAGGGGGAERSGPAADERTTDGAPATSMATRSREPEAERSARRHESREGATATTRADFDQRWQQQAQPQARPCPTRGCCAPGGRDAHATARARLVDAARVLPSRRSPERGRAHVPRAGGGAASPRSRSAGSRTAGIDTASPCVRCSARATSSARSKLRRRGSHAIASIPTRSWRAPTCWPAWVVATRRFVSSPASSISRSDDIALHERLANAFDRAGDAARSCAHRIRSPKIGRMTRTRSALRSGASAPRETAILAELLLASVREESVRSRAVRVAESTATPSTPRGEVMIDASWGGGDDVDIALIAPDGSRLSWMGGRTTLVGRDAAASGHEQLGLRSASVGQYLIEVTRTNPDDHAPFAGSCGHVRSTARARSRSCSTTSPTRASAAWSCAARAGWSRSARSGDRLRGRLTRITSPALLWRRSRPSPLLHPAARRALPRGLPALTDRSSGRETPRRGARASRTSRSRLDQRFSSAALTSAPPAPAARMRSPFVRRVSLA